MANYLTDTYVDNLIGNKVRLALFTEGTTYSSTAFVATCEAATSVIQTAIRSSGYEVPATTTDAFIMLATLGEFINIAFARPDKRLPLPEGYSTSPWMTARAAILSGESELDLDIIVAAAIGGISSSDSSATSESGLPTIFSRHDLDVY
jgi:hypothetical protein